MTIAEFILKFISDIYGYTLFFSALYAIYSYRRVDKATKFICMLIWLSSVTESVAWLAVVKFSNNLPVYGVASIAEFIVICLYFNDSLPYYKHRHTGRIVAAAGALFGILNTIIFQPLLTINSNFLFVECICVVCLSLFAIYQRLMATDMRLLKETHFWGSCIFLGYKCSALWSWGFYDYVSDRFIGQIIYLNIGLLLVNLLTYLSLAILLFLCPKMRRIYV